MRKIAFLTDVHLDEQLPIDYRVNAKANFERALADVSAKNIKEIIFGGDIGSVTSHPYFFGKLKKFPFNLILGNHDKFKEIARYFNPAKKRDEMYYRIEDARCKFLFLDTSKNEVSPQQLDWLPKQLITNKKLMLFIHHPVLPIYTPMDRKYPLRNWSEIKNILVDTI